MDIHWEEKSRDEREKLTFRLLLLNKWFLIPSSVAYEWFLSISPFKEAVYVFIKPTILYTVVSMIVIVLLWLTYYRYADREPDKYYFQHTRILSLVSYGCDVAFVLLLIFLPAEAGNILWFLFLPPLSLIVLVPRMKRYPHLLVDVTATVVMLIAILGLLHSVDSPTSAPHFNPCDILLCLFGMLFTFVSIRSVRMWIDSMNRDAEIIDEWYTLWTETLRRFPADFFLINVHGEILVASNGIRKLFTLPEPGGKEWPEETQPIRNAILLRFHAEKELDKTITVPDDNLKTPIRIFPNFFGYKDERYCIALVQEDNKEIGAPMGIVRSDRLTIAGQIAAGLAHELGNPLGVIQSCASYLHQKSAEDDPNREEYELIEKESRRCHNLIQRLLSLASPKRDTPAVHDLRGILEHSISLVKYQAGSREIELEKPNRSIPIYVNEGQLSAVFINLLLNALQSMEQSPAEAKLRVHTRTRGNEAIVDVTDEGVGISAKELEKIFDPFFTKRAEGTGLGLSIVHQVVTALGGRIDVASIPGSGTTFTVYLPLHEDTEGT
ncbi:MAG: GHKL domain-containing protein [Candidatus Omnitrophota bacterium]|jgi:signal transduction histidine kinase|nr:MAG: GHKL domain-containing protein [Candidatus Omnitrophota bacterium]